MAAVVPLDELELELLLEELELDEEDEEELELLDELELSGLSGAVALPPPQAAIEPINRLARNVCCIFIL